MAVIMVLTVNQLDAHGTAVASNGLPGPRRACIDLPLRLKATTSSPCGELMPTRRTSVLASIETCLGRVVVRRRYSQHQQTWLLIFSGPQGALLLVLPGWKPRSSTSARAQLTPPLKVDSERLIATWWRCIEPRLRLKLSGRTPDPFSVTGTSPPSQRPPTTGSGLHLPEVLP